MPCGQPSSAASIWPVWLQSSSMACLPRMTSCGLLLLDDRLQDLGDGERLDGPVGLDQDAAVGAHGERGADGLLRLLRADRDGDDLGRLAPSFSRIASSTAISSKGFMDILTLASSTPEPSGLTRIFTL